MIRKISLADLLPGMFVVDVHKGWLEHSLWRRRFVVRDSAHIQSIRENGIVELSIDTDKGIDVPEKKAPVAPPHVAEHKFISLTDRLMLPRKVSLGEERRRASRLLGEAGGVVLDLMLAARAGHHVDAARLEPVVSKMIDSIMRNPDALVPLARLKKMDAYATDHAVATASLMIALGLHQGIPEPDLEKMALGTLVKDVGQAALDARLIGKAGSLSSAEFSVVQSHVEEGLAVLEATSRLSELSVAVVMEHHERFDGSGYPYRMAGEEISAAGRMAAIVDTYDAMTSDRPYRPAISPQIALRQLFEEGDRHFDPNLVAAFIRTLGVFPVGTLVLLESGHLAVVDEVNHENSLTPIVRVIYHTGRQQYVTPVIVDLSRKIGNHYGKILRAEEYERWGLSPLRWQPA